MDACTACSRAVDLISTPLLNALGVDRRVQGRHHPAGSSSVASSDCPKVNSLKPDVRAKSRRINNAQKRMRQCMHPNGQPPPGTTSGGLSERIGNSSSATWLLSTQAWQ